MCYLAVAMHELSIALSLIDVATEAIISSHATGRVAAVRVRVGLLSGIDRDALAFSFDVAASGSVLEGARLHVEDVAVTAWCPSCAAERAVVSISSRRCTVCRTIAPRIVRGEELELVGVEIEEDGNETDRGPTRSAEQE